MTTTAMSGSRLSDLPDDLLRRVLFFAPAKEGAATAVLARRWRSLWRSSGGVNLASRLGPGAGVDRPWTRHDYPLSVAEGALAAARAEGPVRRITLHLEEKSHAGVDAVMSRSFEGMIDFVLYNPAVRRVEELRLTAHMSRPVDDSGGRAPDYSGGWYKLRLAELPSEALRVLHVGDCHELVPAFPGEAAFPRLAVLQLRRCTVLLTGLQGLIDAAPQLATLQLERCCLSGAVEAGAGTAPATWVAERYRLRCPAVTVLVLASCRWPGWAPDGMVLDVPKLRYFRYKGFVERLSLASHAPDIHLGDLHFVDEVNPGEHKMLDKMRVSFWQFVHNFSDAKVLKVKLNFPIENIAVAKKTDRGKILGDKIFRNLERLELEGHHVPWSDGAAVAIANMLHCCPVVCDLRLSLKTQGSRIAVIAFDDEEEDDIYYVSDIPGLSGCSFNCLQSSLRRVRLQFQLEFLNCFGVQLAKFLAENALVLEDFHVDVGKHKLRPYIDRKVRRWVIDSSNRRRNSPSTPGSEFLPSET
ncbi:hypothetical protein ACP70R_008176 [Stipagrostis hirtigluma subsp. patula]